VNSIPNTLRDDAVLEQDISALLSKIELGISFWEDAGELAVKLKEKHEDFFVQVADRHEWVTIEMLNTLEAIGRKTLHPRLLLAPKFTLSQFASLSYAEQKYAVENPLAVAERTPANGYHWHHRNVNELTPAEVKQVVGEGRLRDRKAQEAFLTKQDVVAEVLGRWTLMYCNRKVFTKQGNEPPQKCQRIEVDEHGNAFIEIVRKPAVAKAA
jgi:hypothetical protein